MGKGVRIGSGRGRGDSWPEELRTLPIQSEKGETTMRNQEDKSAKIGMSLTGHGTAFVWFYKYILKADKMRRGFALILVGILGASSTAKAGYWWWGRDAELLDGIRAPFWPVWARPGNDNIISRIKVFGERFS